MNFSGYNILKLDTQKFIAVTGEIKFLLYCFDLIILRPREQVCILYWLQYAGNEGI